MTILCMKLMQWHLKNYLGFVRRQIHGKLCSRKHSSPSFTASSRKSVRLLLRHRLNVCLASGLFMRPHRARMGDKMLSGLVFLKCNKHI